MRLVATIMLSVLLALIILVPLQVFFNNIESLVVNFPEAREFIRQGFYIIVAIVSILALLLVVELNTPPYK